MLPFLHFFCENLFPHYLYSNGVTTLFSLLNLYKCAVVAIFVENLYLIALSFLTIYE